MDTNIPYMPSVKNTEAILKKIQSAGVPEAFGYDFLRDLGFTSSNDRSIVKVLKYLGMLDSSGIPQTSYRNFTNQTQSKYVLAECIKTAYDDLFLAHPDAPSQSGENLKGWFKSKTGTGDAVATKIASTFKALAGFADFSKSSTKKEKKEPEESIDGKEDVNPPKDPPNELPPKNGQLDLGLVYRIEIHLPDTQNVETYRAIFKAIREELAQ